MPEGTSLEGSHKPQKVNIEKPVAREKGTRKPRTYAIFLVSAFS
jgi:hypothetical protein